MPWAAAALAGPLHFYLIYDLIRLCLSERSSRFGAGRVWAALVTRTVGARQTHAGHQPRTKRATRAVRRCRAVFHHPDFPNRVRPPMDHGGLGPGRCSALLALSPRTASGTAPCRRRIACRGIHAARANPAVLSYHPRAAFPILTGIFTPTASRRSCLFAAGRLLAPPRNRVLGGNALPLLYTLGTMLAFLIVNIEIADYFSTQARPR